MDVILQKLAGLWPEIVMLVGAVACLAVGLSPSRAARRATVGIAAGALLLAGLLTVFSPADRALAGLGFAGLAHYVKLSVVLIGLVLLMVAANLPRTLRQNREAEASPQGFVPDRAVRGEFFAFFLFSLTGVMLTAGATDLVWLFLALELVSLPTYVMVCTGRERIEAQESAVKYFFLGALSVAVFLYGFTMIYGATGHTAFAVYDEGGQLVGGIRHAIEHGLVSQQLLLVGVVLSVVGIAFKTAAVPMHGYVADVYEGAATPVSAFLAFVPKLAGFVAIMLVLGLWGWPLDRVAAPGGEYAGQALTWVLWLMAALTMTIGNVLALLQDNIKRVLAYSSVAQSGYLLVGVLAGPGVGGQGHELSDGLAGALFYLLAYGFATIAAFAVLGCLATGHSDRRGEDERSREVQTYDDLSGLYHRHPILAIIMAAAMLSLLGVPPLVGFLGKLYLFTPAVGAGFIGLVVLAVINSAISAGYYLRIASVCFFGTPNDRVIELDVPLRRIGAAIGALASLALFFAGSRLIESADHATTTPERVPQAVQAPAQPEATVAAQR